MNYSLRILAAFCVAAAIPFSAQALTVSNLDEVAHFVVFEETQGSKLVKQVQPGETIRVPVIGGRAYLRDRHTHEIRVEELDRLAIWPEAGLVVQQRRTNRGGSR